MPKKASPKKKKPTDDELDEDDLLDDEDFDLDDEEEDDDFDDDDADDDEEEEEEPAPRKRGRPAVKPEKASKKVEVKKLGKSAGRPKKEVVSSNEVAPSPSVGNNEMWVTVTFNVPVSKLSTVQKALA